MSATIGSYEFLLFYKYFEIQIDNPDELVQSQQSLCTTLLLNGRVRVSKEGMNGILSGLSSNILSYRAKMNEIINDIQWYKSGLVSKSTLSYNQQVFETLSVKVTKEVVSLDIGFEKMSEVIKAGSGKYLEPEEFHQHLKAMETILTTTAVISSSNNDGDDVNSMGNNSITNNGEYKLIDVRNQYEVRIGTFQGENFSAVNPETRQVSNSLSSSWSVAITIQFIGLSCLISRQLYLCISKTFRA